MQGTSINHKRRSKFSFWSLNRFHPSPMHHCFRNYSSRKGYTKTLTRSVISHKIVLDLFAAPVPVSLLTVRRDALSTSYRLYFPLRFSFDRYSILSTTCSIDCRRRMHTNAVSPVLVRYGFHAKNTEASRARERTRARGSSLARVQCLSPFYSPVGAHYALESGSLRAQVHAASSLSPSSFSARRGPPPIPRTTLRVGMRRACAAVSYCALLVLCARLARFHSYNIQVATFYLCLSRSSLLRLLSAKGPRVCVTSLWEKAHAWDEGRSRCTSPPMRRIFYVCVCVCVCAHTTLTNQCTFLFIPCTLVWVGP